MERRREEVGRSGEEKIGGVERRYEKRRGGQEQRRSGGEV